MKYYNDRKIYPMFYHTVGQNIHFFMGSYSFYITKEEFDSMKETGLSEENILAFTFEMMLNKKLGDFSDLVPLFQDRFN